MYNKFQKVAAELQKLSEALKGLPKKASGTEDSLNELKGLGNDLIADVDTALKSLGNLSEMDLSDMRNTVGAISACFDSVEYELEEEMNEDSENEDSEEESWTQ